MDVDISLKLFCYQVRASKTHANSVVDDVIVTIVLVLQLPKYFEQQRNPLRRYASTKVADYCGQYLLIIYSLQVYVYIDCAKFLIIFNSILYYVKHY